MIVKLLGTLIWFIFGVACATYGAYSTYEYFDAGMPKDVAICLSTAFLFCFYGVTTFSVFENIWEPEEDEEGHDSTGYDFYDALSDFEDWLVERDMADSSRAYVQSLIEEYHREKEAEEAA